MAVLGSLGGACGGDDTDSSNNPGGTAGVGGTAGMGGGVSGMGGGTAGMGGGVSGMGGGMAGMGGTAGMGGGLCMNTTDAPNPDCPSVEPLIGECAPRGACCHRAANSVKEATLGPDDPLVLEYRVNYSVTVNHPMSIGIPQLADSTTMRYEAERQSTIWRFVLPRQGGMEVSGEGMATFGVGRYNCDGTYSYYSATAAPNTPQSSNAGRWQARQVPVNVDVTKSGADRVRPTFANNANRELTFTPFLNDTDFTLDWELVHQGFDILTMDFSGAGRECIGSRADGEWTAGGQFVIYTPMKENDIQPISLISQTYCQLVAFSVLPDGMKGMKCMDTPRCMPDGGMPGTADGGCPWVKLPDSLCPETEDEKALFGCHLGAKGNPNQEMGYPDDATINCTDEAPTSPADPAVGSPGQCCDPLGMSDTLPACNAYRLIQDYVAAAAEITDELKDEVQPNCVQ